MNWLIIQSAGEHKGQDGWDRNDMLRECFAIQHALLCFGDKADIWGKGHTNYSQTPDFQSYDGIFTIENYGLDWLPDISRCWRALRIHWVIDAHWTAIENFDRVLPQNDIVLHSTRRFIPPYKARFPKQKHVYFPNGVDNRYFDRCLYLQAPHTKDIIFIGGNAAPRATFIDHMVRECGMEYRYGITGMSYIRAILDAKIQFNRALNFDINYRNWETIGLATCLLTQHDPEMELLGFKHDVNCLFYHTPEEACSLAKAYLASGEWERVAEAGFELSTHHSYVKRIPKLIHNLFTNESCQHTLWNTPTPASATTSLQPSFQ